jgi:hypothetical protein
MSWKAEFNAAPSRIYVFKSSDPVSVLIEIEDKLQNGWALHALTSENNHTKVQNSVIIKPSSEGQAT